jgi:ubiquinone/menaquinone biosynthesis C-methylase UbiE
MKWDLSPFFTISKAGGKIMRKTDYSRIAGRYDLNPIRKRIPDEPLISEMLKLKDGHLKILDLACGTGNFLHAQYQRYGHLNIAWYGCDLSNEMLEFARSKVPSAHFRICDAASLPCQDDFFDMITCNFAFHHFQGKSECLDEVRRTLKAKGAFLMQNISPEDMPSWWIYHYFPSTRAIDQERFWSRKRIKAELKNRGFTARIATTEMKELSIQNLVAEAENRDISQLTLIDEPEYEEGIDRMKDDLQGGKSYHGELVLLRIVAERIA